MTAKKRPTKLSELQIRLLEVNDLNLKLSLAEKRGENLKLALMEAQAKIHNMEIERQREKCREFSKKCTARLSEKASFIDTIEKKFKLSKGWGYDPDSGELKQGE